MRKYLVLWLLVNFQVLGDVWLSRGMRQLGTATISTPADLGAIGVQLLTNPWLLLGALFLVSALLLYLAALSRLDLSYVLPMTAAKYVLSALCAWLVLGESVSALRWGGTLLVSGGVLLVSLGDFARARSQPRSQRPKRSQFPALLLAPTAASLSLSSVGLAIVGMVLAASAGDILLTAGMKQVGTVTTIKLRSLLTLARRVILNPWIVGGVLCMAADFFLFIGLLSRTDLSLVMPMTALSYPVSLLGSHYLLRETVTTERLAGTALIGLGVALIAANAAAL